MIPPAVKETMVCIAAFVLLLLAGGTAQARAENRALDLNLARQEDRTRCVIRLDSPPVYSLTSEGGNEVRLVLRNTLPTPSFTEGLTETGSATASDPDIAAPDLGLRLQLPAALEELSVAWMPSPGALYLEFFHGQAGSPSQPSDDGKAVLNRIHFGFMDMRTRMALTLDARAPWEISQPSRDRVRLRLPTVREELDRESYGPARNLALATLIRENEGTDIEVRLLTRIDRIRLFWMKGRPRLVADLFEGSPMEETPEATLAASPENPASPESPETESAPSTGPPEKIAQSGHQGTGTASNTVAEAALESSGPVIRGRIVRNGFHDAETPREASRETAAGRESGDLSEEELMRGLQPDEALLYGNIRQAEQQGDAARAADLCDEFQKQFPGSPMDEKVCFIKGRAEFALVQAGDKDRFGAMMKTYQDAITTYRRSPEVHEAYLNMARAAGLVGNDYAAIGYINIALHGASDPETSARAILERGSVYLKLNQPEKAVKDFQAVLEQHPDSSAALEARMGVARYFQAVGLHERAEEELARLLDEHPGLYLDHPDILFLRGKSALYLKQYDRARDSFFRALNIGGQPEGPDLLLARIGDTYHHASMPREAEAVYRTVLRDYPDTDGASMAKLRLAGYDSGYEGFEALRKENPDQPVADLAALEMARKYYEEGRFDMAMKTLRGLLDKPFQSDIQMEARNLYFRTVEQEMKRLHREGKVEALVDFHLDNQAEIQRNIDPEILLLAGLALHRQERNSEAISVLEGIKPYDLNQVSKGQRVLALVDSYLRAGMEDRALLLLEKKGEKDLLPAADRQRLDFLLAGMYRDGARYAEAYALYKDLVQGERLLGDRDIASAYLDMGRIAARDGRLEEARTFLNRCIALVEHSEPDRPTLYRAYAELGNAYYLDGRHKDALEAFNRALGHGFSAQDSGFRDMQFLMAQSYLEMGDTNRAEPLFIEISEEGEGLLQKRVQIRLGMLGLEKQLQRLSIRSNGNP